MSGQGRSLMSSSSSHHRTHQETHRSHSGSSHSRTHSYTQSHTHSQHSTSRHVSTSTSVNHWHSQTNSKGHLVIAKKLEPNKSADRKIERKIRDILEDFNEDASPNQVTRTTDSIMKAVQKYNRGEYNGTDQPATKAPGPQLPSTQTPVKSSLKVTPKYTKVVEPKKVADRLAGRRNTERPSSQRIHRELMQLTSSDGFVVKPPIESKRTSKRVCQKNI